jgi:hypothetical protein
MSRFIILTNANEIHEYEKIMIRKSEINRLWSEENIGMFHGSIQIASKTYIELTAGSPYPIIQVYEDVLHVNKLLEEQ